MSKSRLEMKQLQPQEGEIIPFGTTYVEFHAKDKEAAERLFERISSPGPVLWGKESAIMLDTRRAIVSISRLAFGNHDECTMYPFEEGSMDLGSMSVSASIQNVRNAMPETEIKFFKSDLTPPAYDFPSREAFQKDRERKTRETASILFFLDPRLRGYRDR